ncbi:MAG: hypothetical protein MUF49_26005 [Oculatellaceae cyanobacterium Prado106]|jgi:hypothetical protein|nr:hypothetical protein [Oculatellaceae cyanobacterium Prado106]
MEFGIVSAAEAAADSDELTEGSTEGSIGSSTEGAIGGAIEGSTGILAENSGEVSEEGWLISEIPGKSRQWAIIDYGMSNGMIL